MLNERTRIVHLLRRAGFGASRAERERYFALGLNGTLDRLLDDDAIADPVEQQLAGMTFDLTRPQELQRWWFVRMVGTDRPLREKMTLFWHGFLTSALTKVQQPAFMLNQNKLFRASAMTTFDTMLKAVTRDPAMLTWLDNRSNQKAAPNENYARELLELYSMGVGNYAETDVKAAARALTGMGVQRDGSYTFRPQLFDSGVKTFLGHTGPFGADDIIAIICRHKATPRFLAGKLFRFFAHENPTDAEIAPMVQAYQASGYSLRAMLRALFSADAFYGDATYRAHITSPAEFVASTYRTLGIPLTARTGADGPRLMQLMGQQLFNPPDPSGWDEGPFWIGTGGLLQRVNFAATLSRSNTVTAAALVDNATSAAAIIDALLSLLVDGAVSAQTRTTLLTQVSAAPAGALPPSGRFGRALQLVLSLPEYQFA